MTSIDRRRRAAEAGHRRDEAAARAFLDDDDERVRATALGALARMAALQESDIAAMLVDESSVVRKRACEEARKMPGPDLVPMLADGTALVAEAAAWALGERGVATDAVVTALAAMAREHTDALCREAAVAALGALGDERGRSTILAALEDKPAIRRRAVIALAPFEGDDVDAALRRALSDRDWQVRQAAEDLVHPQDDDR